MAESTDPADNKAIPLNEETEEETEIALQSNENQHGVALRLVKPSFNLNEGTFDRANFGPQTNMKHVEANTIEHATISHVHHHYGGDHESEESPSGGTGGKSKQKGGSEGRSKQKLKEYLQICNGIFMNTEKPLRGGTKIYEGYQENATGQGSPLAIKAIIPCTKKSILEVQSLVGLAMHPNVVKIVKAEEYKGHLPALYVAMELCSSQNLQDYLNENRKTNVPFDFKKTVLYSKLLVDGMKHIHQNQIVHGDLKPENILFSKDGDQIKVSNFGIGKELRHSASHGYRAPETYSCDAVSMMADVYSLGITLYSLFTNGKHPFGDEPDLWKHHMKKNIGRDLSGLPEAMGVKKDEFLKLLMQMLEFDPKKRPTIKEISEDPFFSSSPATKAKDIRSGRKNITFGMSSMNINASQVAIGGGINMSGTTNISGGVSTIINAPVGQLATGNANITIQGSGNNFVAGSQRNTDSSTTTGKAVYGQSTCYSYGGENITVHRSGN